MLNRSTQNSYLLAQLRPTLIIGSIFSLLRAELSLSLKSLFNKEKVRQRGKFLNFGFSNFFERIDDFKGKTRVWTIRGTITPFQRWISYFKGKIREMWRLEMKIIFWVKMGVGWWMKIGRWRIGGGWKKFGEVWNWTSFRRFGKIERVFEFLVPPYRRTGRTKKEGIPRKLA